MFPYLECQVHANFFFNGSALNLRIFTAFNNERGTSRVKSMLTFLFFYNHCSPQVTFAQKITTERAWIAASGFVYETSRLDPTSTLTQLCTEALWKCKSRQFISVTGFSSGLYKGFSKASSDNTYNFKEKWEKECGLPLSAVDEERLRIPEREREHVQMPGKNAVGSLSTFFISPLLHGSL